MDQPRADAADAGLTPETFRHSVISRMAERPAWLKARAGRVAITIGLLMCLPGAVGLVLGLIVRQRDNANLPLWSSYRAINLPIWLGLLFLLTGLGYIAWGALRLRSLR